MAPAARAPVLAEGSRVLIQGLRASQYNNSTAIVKSMLDNGRVCVLLDSPNGKELSIKAEHLIKTENLMASFFQRLDSKLPGAGPAGAPVGGSLPPTGRTGGGGAAERLRWNVTYSNTAQVQQCLKNLYGKLCDLEDKKD